MFFANIYYCQRRNCIMVYGDTIYLEVDTFLAIVLHFLFF
jgi:hypothetical protein